MKADTMSDEAIRSGYKRTEIGEIPKDWEIKAFGELFDFLPTSSLPRNSLSDSGDIYYIHYGDIHTKWDYHLDFGTATVPLIASKKVTNAARLRDGDLIMVDASEDEEGVGKSVEVVNLGNRVAVAGLHTLALRSKERFLANGFKAYLQANEMVKAQIRRIATGLKVFGISKNSLTGLLLPLPGRVEQSAIAEALSDVDALLDALDRLIAKKRAIKQGAMQALLTGRVRLPGFSGEWVNKQLSNLADIRSGGTPSTTQPKFWDGSMPWCTPTDITALQGTKYLTETRRTITVEGLENSSAEIIPARSIVMTSRATIGECAINLIPVSTNQGFKNFVPFEAVDVEFLYYLLTTKKQRFISLCGGSTFLEIGKAQLATFEVILPATTAEQRAIAEVLSNMDAEIDALEKRRAKLRDIKQGMMQELLTGRIRLVQPKESAQEAHV